MEKIVRKHTDWEVYRRAFAAAMQVFEITREFPKEERYSLVDQIRRSSRSVCANLAEAWRKRRYRAAFLCKLNECEAEAAETQAWIQFAVECKYVSRDLAAPLYSEYDAVLGMLVSIINHPDDWLRI
jgi:four helix bundle protein